MLAMMNRLTVLDCLRLSIFLTLSTEIVQIGAISDHHSIRHLSDSSFVYDACPKEADPDDCPVPNYAPCTGNETSCNQDDTPKARRQRRLQLFDSKPKVKQFEIENDDQPLPYDQPCYSPSRNEMAESWTKWVAAEDDSVEIDLSFNFIFFGREYNKTFISDNGFLTFENTFRDNYQPSALPSGLSTPMIAPFWADAEVAENGGRGHIWYRDFGGKLAVIWDEVGYFTGDDEEAMTHNSFQVVISKDQDFVDMNNICFCYLDMGWTHGNRDGVNGFEPIPRVGQSRAATVGITDGLAAPFGTATYAQIGRFNTSGNVHNGVRISSGVDWLDFLGSTAILDSRTGFCFNSGPNMPPVFKGGPTNGTVSIPCGGNLEEYKVYFGAPEFNQKLVWEVLSQPEDTPPGFTASIDGNGLPDDTLGIRFEWLDIDFQTYGGQSFDFNFKVCDNARPPACITEPISFFVEKCGIEENCSPEKCTPIIDSECEDEFGPSCIAFLSGEHCDPQYSFPMLIASRYPMIRESLRGPSDILGESGWWYHYTDDRAGGYSFTRNNGEAAPPLLCCVTSINDLLGVPGDPSSSACFQNSTLDWTTPIVIRAEGHHGGTGVFVLPEGLDIQGGPTTELGTGSGAITLDQVRNYLNGLTPSPKKILVEKFIAGTGSGSNATLPDEYKFHMFNGKIGSISVFYNPGLPCACYGEFSEDWECHHKYGCFKSQMPFGSMFDGCYSIDFPVGSDPARTTVVKGYDLCGFVPPPDPCLFERMKEIARKLSKALGVYARIDMFVTENDEIYVQEYTFNHLGGTKHCTSRTVDGCVDSCFLGKYWYESGVNSDERAQGGPNLPRPSPFIDGYGEMGDVAQCDVAMSFPPVKPESACR